jgi:succinylglutamate desuccinylase
MTMHILERFKSQEMANRPDHLVSLARDRRPLVVGTASLLSLLASALPTTAFAAPSGIVPPPLIGSPFLGRRPSSPSVIGGGGGGGGARRHHRAGGRRRRFPSASIPVFVRGGEIDDPPPSAAESGAGVVVGRGGVGDVDGVRASTVAPAPSPDPGSSSFTRPIGRVTVVGGTHGNEYTGVWCIKAIERQRKAAHHRRTYGHDSAADGGSGGGGGGGRRRDDDRINVFVDFPTLEIDTLLGNPVAHIQNRRFVDVDLNREFSMEKLLRVPDDRGFISTREECDVRTQFCSDEIRSSLPHEAVRAREIEALLGPKFTPESTSSAAAGGNGGGVDRSYDDPNVDVVVDLHTTTANMGISLIIPEGDALMAAAAAHVLDRCRREYGRGGAQVLMHALPRRQDRMNLSSCGRHGFTIEVGPTPQGVLRHDCVEKTQAALHALLEFFHLRNLELEEWRKNGGGASGDGSPPPSPTLDRLAALYPGGVVPCYRSAPAARPGELSGKIPWPNDPSNPNFPALMVHGSVQDGDFGEIRVGDPLFVDLDGNVVPYDGSHGDAVHVIFVNEGGYYYESSGTGVGVAVRSQFDLQTGEWVHLAAREDCTSPPPHGYFCIQPQKANSLTLFVRSARTIRFKFRLVPGGER